MKKIAIPLFLINLVLMVFSVVSFSAESKLVVDDLVKEGKIFYQRGDHEQAIHEFSKALILDPDNKEAKKYLKKMGISEKGLYQPENPEITRHLRQSQEIDDYKNLVNAIKDETFHQKQLNEKLQNEQVALKDIIVKKEHRNHALKVELDGVQQEKDAAFSKGRQRSYLLEQEELLKSQKISKLDTEIADLKSRLDDKTREMEDKSKTLEGIEKRSTDLEKQLGKLIDDRIAERTKYLKQIEELKKNSLENVEVSSDQPSNPSSVTDALTVAQMRNQMGDMEKELKFLRSQKRDLENVQAQRGVGRVKLEKQTVDMIKRKDEMIAELKSSLASARMAIADLKQNGGAGGKRIVDDLQQELNDVKGKLQEVQNEFAQKNQEYQVLADRLQDTQQRLDVVQKMLEDKERESQDTEKQMQDLLLENHP